MAEVGAIYDATPVPRTPADILPGNDTQHRDATRGPTAHNKWLTASVAHDAAAIVAAIFDEADRRDPHHTRTWVALVDGKRLPPPRQRPDGPDRPAGDYAAPKQSLDSGPYAATATSRPTGATTSTKNSDARYVDYTVSKAA